jgi:hypothetical protein
MKTPRILPCSVLAVGLVAVLSTATASAAQPQASASARATTEFVQSEKFSDFRDSVMETDKGRAALEERFSTHVAKLGEQYLPEGQRLEIRFTNIDLAGDFEPWRGPEFDDIRILKDLYAPRMELEYRLVDTQSGAVIRQGTEKLSNMSYMMSALPINTNESLRHDFELLTNWVRREFRKESK